VHPLLCLVTPVAAEPAQLPRRVALVLDAAPPGWTWACLRLATAGMAEDAIRAAATALRPLAEARGLGFFIESHWRLVRPLGFDGVHLPDGSRSLREARRELGEAAEIGAFCGVSRHAGLVAAEIGADYVAFGPFGERGGLGDGRRAGTDLVEWWAETIETPVIAEGGLAPEAVAALGSAPEFLALGAELWDHPAGPATALRALLGG
jgi:thiamine-phosphate pyrophosphorylase